MDNTRIQKNLATFVLLGAISISFFSCCNKTATKEEKSPVDYVNPYMGNISHLLVPTYPTVHLPNSMLRVYPERADYTSDRIKGLPVVVTSHRGSSAFNISPVSGTHLNGQTVKQYTYDLEKITPYRYRVYLDEEQIEVDYAPSHQSGIYKLIFNHSGENSIVVNTVNGTLALASEALSGFQLIDKGPTKVYLYLETEQTPVKKGILTNESIDYAQNIVTGENAAVVLTFNAHIVNIRYGISFISTEQAKKNLQREMNTFSVDEIAAAGRDKWNKVLAKIRVESEDENQKTVFYTSLYRTYERMINISEDGKYYSAFDEKIHADNGIPFYTDDWIWDTYRATHPLRVLIEPEMEKNMIESYIRMAEQSPNGWMPTFPEVTGDSHRMNGNHAVAVIWDAYCKGLTGFDLGKAYIACKAAITEKSLLPWTKIPLTDLDRFYWEKGYFPALKEGEQETCQATHDFEKRQAISLILGNSYDTWCLSEIAGSLDKTADHEYFLKASYNYRNVFNAETQFFHPKDKNGEFIQPFDYRFSGGVGARNYYGENNGWVYRWDVQHNIADLIDLMQGPENFVKNLDATFVEPLGKGKNNFFEQLPDHTGNVGQFSMANEPSLHIPYLYNYAGQPWKTQKRIRNLLNQWFRNDLMGIPGDEDGGGMSAFVVFSAMGFYPVTPGSPTYSIGSPLFDYVKLDLGNGKFFEIEALNNSTENKYIQSAKLNGKELNQAWFSHEDIIDGGKLELVMGAKANENWGRSPDITLLSAAKLWQ
ncbi:MAG: glycoside hydrolase family 92 protein [Dysgonamonadaceae bacterium]|jgi:predicted alpha-1,2-mannosidase|nr:glycoside hydrolase family 92 protein [Dysgonamonadaceae bacterium]